MTFTRFVIKNVTRNRRRTAFTVLSIGFSLFLLLTLYTFLDRLYNPKTSEDSATRLVVERSTSLADTLPVAAMAKLEKVPHVTMVMPFQWFGGVYKEPKNFFAQLAGDPVKLFDFYPEFKWSPGSREAFQADRRAAIVGVDLLERYGWKVGDTITLTKGIFPVDAELKIVGTYTVPPTMDRNAQNTLYFRFDYFNELMKDAGVAGTLWLKADKPESVPGIIQTVDAMFRNSPYETKTQSEKSFQLGFVEMLGNIRVLIGSIAIVVVFTMLLVVGSTMAMTIRERLKEVAILKAIGFSRGRVLSLILGESMLLGLLGFIVGTLFVITLDHMPLYQMTQGFVSELSPTREIYAGVLGVSVLIGLVSGFPPALSASSLSIAEAIRRLE